MPLHVLRLAAAALGALLLAVGLLGPISVNAPIWTGIYFIVLGVGLIVITIIGEPRYWPSRRESGGALRPTEERFIDPTSGTPMGYGSTHRAASASTGRRPSRPRSSSR